jgi:hypothetical protein
MKLVNERLTMNSLSMDRLMVTLYRRLNAQRSKKNGY